MGAGKTFIRFGDLKPDRQRFGNDGLLVAHDLIPAYRGYVVGPAWGGTSSPGAEPYGMHAHYADNANSYVYVGTNDKLFEAPRSTMTLTDKSGAVYATSTSLGWYGASFGDAAIMTNYNDEVQYLPSPATATFANMIQSGGGSPGMRPKAQFVFPVRNNLFLAKLNLSATFDGLPSGANPTTVAWSQSDNIRQFGSSNITPELIGAGYQSLNYDGYGHISGGIGGEYGLVAMHGGWVRIDGPPYTFRPIARNVPCRFPNSIVRLGDDVYFFGPAGPGVLRGGETYVSLAEDCLVRTLIDNFSGFSPTYAIEDSISLRHVSAAVDVVNNIVAWFFTSEAGSLAGDIGLFYNVVDDRFSFSTSWLEASGECGILFARNFQDAGGSWSPIRDFVAMALNAGAYRLVAPSYQLVGASPFPRVQTAFVALDEKLTTRITSVRPIFSRSSLVTSVSTEITIGTVNKPYDTPAETSASAQNTHGDVTVPDSLYGNFHRIGVRWITDGVGTDLQTITEIEGVEVSYVTGGVYAA